MIFDPAIQLNDIDAKVAGGIVTLWIMARSRFVDRYLTRLIERALKRWTDLDVRDYQSLLKLSGEYMVKELSVKKGGWLADKTLQHCRLTEEGVIVLGVYRRNGDYVGAPKAETKIYPRDQLILYSRAKALRQLDERKADSSGEAAHDRAVSEQARHIATQDDQKKEHESRRSAAREPTNSA
jgi:hypothetical protein